MRSLGYEGEPQDSDYWYGWDTSRLTEHFKRGPSPDQARTLKAMANGPWRFQYRQSPQRLLTLNPASGVSALDPPQTLPGMVSIVLDKEGKLLYFSAVPPPDGGDPVPMEPDWTPLLKAAHLDPKTLAAVPLRPIPPHVFDHRAAWDTTIDGEHVAVTAAAFKGKPVYFDVTFNPPPSSAASDEAKVKSLSWEEVSAWAGLVIMYSVLLACLLLARRNVRLGRGDRTGAVRVAAVMFIARMILWIFSVHHVADIAEIDKLLYSVALSFLMALYAYVYYLALEPHFRRRWPRSLVSWARVLTGRFGDSRVGRDLLVGCLAGCVMVIVREFVFALPAWINLPGPNPRLPYSNMVFFSSGPLISAAFAMLSGINAALSGAAILLVISFFVRRDWLAFAITVAVFSIPTVFTWMDNPLPVIPALLLSFALAAIVFWRLGILALVVTAFAYLLLLDCYLASDLTRWYRWPTVVCLAIIAALAISGFRAALAGRPVFGRTLVED